jgi:hypothetical protein
LLLCMGRADAAPYGRRTKSLGTQCQRLRSLVGLKELKVGWLQSLQYRKVHIEVYSISCVKRSACLWKEELVNPEETWDS